MNMPRMQRQYPSWELVELLSIVSSRDDALPGEEYLYN